MPLRPGEVLLIRIEFHQRSGGELRPAVALLDNFCRIHGSLRVTPAMEAGITDHVWGVSELLDH
jgi:hypothetical protein